MNYDKEIKLFEQYYDDLNCPEIVIKHHKIEKCDECGVCLINYDSMHVCPNCGLSYGYDSVQEFKDYIRCPRKQKSIYKRRGYLQSILQRYDITGSLWGKITSIFCELEQIFERGDYNRKNMISYNIVIRGILRKIDESKEIKKIPKLKTKKTRIIHLKLFKQLWVNMA